MTVVSTLDPSFDLERSIILNIFSSIGRCRFLDEKHFDACTALSGSGPAFACIFLEAMADGGVMMGLPRAEALELAAQSELVAVYLANWVHRDFSVTRDCPNGASTRCTPRSD
jgi:pyrroline-5-carboxylate reductase